MWPSLPIGGYHIKAVHNQSNKQLHHGSKVVGSGHSPPLTCYCPAPLTLPAHGLGHHGSNGVGAAQVKQNHGGAQLHRGRQAGRQADDDDGDDAGIWL